ncbi:MAG: hypothetical protein HW416_1936 [Chloroflexi bacterium]|nr:hypothetical protein [Chloroflexota bacterium]
MWPSAAPTGWTGREPISPTRESNLARHLTLRTGWSGCAGLGISCHLPAHDLDAHRPGHVNLLLTPIRVHGDLLGEADEIQVASGAYGALGDV